MRVIPNNGTPELTGVSSPSAQRPPRLEQDHLTLNSAEALSQALAATPAVRQDKVAQARQLVLDTSYPPEVLINKISALFATRLGPKDPLNPEDPKPDAGASADNGAPQ